MADTDQGIKRWDQRVDWTSNELSTRLMVAAMKQEIAELRSALASRPAEVDDEGLPPLPEETMLGTSRHGSIFRGYTAEQFRQGQRDAVAADRALLHECKRFLEDMHAMPVEWTIKESQVLHEKLSAPSHTTNKEK